MYIYIYTTHHVPVQYRMDGYSVFVVRGGTLPPPSKAGPYTGGVFAGSPGAWHDDVDLANATRCSHVQYRNDLRYSNVTDEFGLSQVFITVTPVAGSPDA
jgi:hypothetical protein